MADLQKTKIIDIQTGKSEKNVKSLKTQIRELRDQLGMLEQDTQEYNDVARQLAEVQQKQIEINEAAKYSNKDVGQTLSNLTTISAGVIGAFNGVSAVMQMMGADSEDAAEALKTIQLTMAVIQGLSSMDTAIKALDGLKNAFKGLNTERMIGAGATIASTTATVGETSAKNANTKSTEMQNAAMSKSIPLQKRIANGFKDIGNAIKTLVTSNPVLFGIAAAIAAVAAAIAIYTKHMKNLNAEKKMMQDLDTNALYQLDEQRVRLYALVQTAEDETEGLAERKKAIEELNKIVPDYNGQLDETTGKYTANNEALETYIENLYEKIKLEAFEGKIKEYLQEQLKLQEKINRIQNGGWNLWNGRIRRAKRDIQDLDVQIDRLFDEIKKLDLSKALDDNKVEGSATATTQTIVKSLKDIVKELKAIYLDLWNTIFDEREFRQVFNGVYNEANILFDNIKQMIKTKDLGDSLSEEFSQAMKDGLPTTTKYNVTVDFIFGKDNVKELEKELMDEEQLLSQLIGERVDEETIKEHQQTVQLLKDELNARKALVEAVQKYADYNYNEVEQQRKLEEAKAEYIKQLEIEEEYKNDKRSNNIYADINKEINSSELLIKQIDERIKARESERKSMLISGVQNKEVVDRLKELNNQQIEDEKTKNEALSRLDEANYQKRLKDLEYYYADAEGKQTKYESDLTNQRTIAGAGTTDYNTDYDTVFSQYQTIMQKMSDTRAYYQQQVQDGLMSQYEADAELQGALTELEQEESEKRIELANAETNRKVNIQQTYINTLSTIAGQIQGLLSAEMSNYDQNSKQYKAMAYANGIIDTLSGTLSAFMSGIQSGIPAPFNIGVAATMASLVFATGLAQLRNIKNGTLANAATSNTVTIGTEYDTLSYQQNADILSAISDARVYVSESDITNTQRRVRVREENSTF